MSLLRALRRTGKTGRIVPAHPSSRRTVFAPGMPRTARFPGPAETPCDMPIAGRALRAGEAPRPASVAVGPKTAGGPLPPGHDPGTRPMRPREGRR